MSIPALPPSGGSGIPQLGLDAAITRFAIFLVVTISPGGDAMATTRAVLADLDGMMKTVAFRDSHARMTCTVGIGATVWSELTARALPAELHQFRPVRGAVHTAPATPGDLLFHVHADRYDLCFEFERLLLAALGNAVTVVDEVAGFRYFDARDLLGFVDGTADPVGSDRVASTLVGSEDPEFAGGSYVVVQKYLHPIEAWQALSAAEQEAIMGRTKPDNVELDDAATGQKSHKTLTTIEDDQGVEHDILRDNMPFGSPGRGEFGTYFIGYTRSLRVIELMLERMFIGDPPGLHDRLLDFSTALTGTAYFAPPLQLLKGLDSIDAATAGGGRKAGTR